MRHSWSVLCGLCCAAGAVGGRPALVAAEASGAAGSSEARVCPPRERWPAGMSCVQGGWFELGTAEGRPNERSPGRAWVETFFMDTHEVSNERYANCIENDQCRRPMPFRGFMGPKQPVVAVSWYDAVAYCEGQGRRLPTEAEWERAASGPNDQTYPWGDRSEGCERAVVKDGQGEGCGRGKTAPVGSRSPGHFGLFDMAGNVHEWVQDFYSDCLRGCDNECGDACFGREPKGPCGGQADRCPGHPLRSVRGGSWYWPLERARASARRGSGAPNRGPHRFGFRCARDLEARPRAPEAPLKPSTQGLLEKIPNENTPPPGRHYYRSNEWRQDLLRQSLRGRGGAYLGVGSDQNYTMAAMADAEWLVLVDYDPMMPGIHATYDALIRQAATPDRLVALFEEANRGATERLLRRELADHPHQARLVNQWKRRREAWHAYLRRVSRQERNGRPHSWLADAKLYDKVRALFRSGRVVSRNGDLTAEGAIRAVGEVCRELGVPVRVVYMSNAEQFFEYNEAFIENMKALPTDERSLVIRTIRHRSIPIAEDGRWHYLVHEFPDFVSRLETGHYRKSFAFTADLLAAGPPFLGRDGLSKITAETPRAILQRSRDRSPSR